MLAIVCSQEHQPKGSEHQDWTTEQWTKLAFINPAERLWDVLDKHVQPMEAQTPS